MKILLIGPLPKPITGQSLVNKVIIEEYSQRTGNKIDFIDTSNSVLEESNGGFNIRKFFLYLKGYSQIFSIRRFDVTYLSIGQTFLGVLRFLPFFLISKLFKTKIVIHIHGNHLCKEYKNLKGLKKKLFKRILSMSDKGIVLSDILKDNLVPFIPSNDILILKNFVESYLLETHYSKCFKKINIVYLSNLLEDKGIFEFLDALVLLKNKNIDFSARIAGQVTDNTKLKIQRYLNELDGFVQYMGVVENEAKKDLLEWSNIFVLPSKLSEGQPMSILESMASGNVILTTKVGGIPDIFKDEVNGYYIEKSSSKSICERLSFLSKNRDLIKSISSNNRSEAQLKYKIDTFIQELNAIFIKAIDH